MEKALQTCLAPTTGACKEMGIVWRQRDMYGDPQKDQGELIMSHTYSAKCLTVSLESEDNGACDHTGTFFSLFSYPTPESQN